MVGSPGAVGRTRVKQSHLYDCLSGAGQCCSLGIWGGFFLFVVHCVGTCLWDLSHFVPVRKWQSDWVGCKD